MAYPRNYRLGSLCRRGHNHEGSGQSLRDGSGRCVMCRNMKGRERDAERYDRRRSDPDFVEYQRAYQRRYQSSETGKTQRRIREKQHREDVTPYAIKQRLRSRLRCAVRNQGWQKIKACEYGIDWTAIVDHLGPRPSDEHEIDHIRPLASFDLSDPAQVREAFAPQNHRWLPADENRAKRDRVA